MGSGGAGLRDTINFKNIVREKEVEGKGSSILKKMSRDSPKKIYFRKISSNYVSI